jgi:SPP1 gp7 family putative phage head morphogenesis protein
VLTREQVRAAQSLSRVRQSGAMPHQQPPTAIELEYTRAVRTMVRRAMHAAYAPLLRELPAMVAGARERRGDLRQDDKNEERRARKGVARARRQMARDLDERTVRSAAGAAADQVNRHNRVQLGRQFEAVLGIDPIGKDKNLRPVVEGFLHENVALIQDITPGLASRIEATVLKALTTGTLHEDLARQLQERAFGYAEERAELIAIDQVGKLYGQINIQRMRDLGITHFIWMSALDERVRGNPTGKYRHAKPSHWDRHGKVFEISAPPLGKNGEREYPGTPIRCRCIAAPVIDDILAGLEDPGEAGLEAALAGQPARPQLALVPPARRGPAPEQVAARAAREAQVQLERAAWEAERAAKLAASSTK